MQRLPDKVPWTFFTILMATLAFVVPCAGASPSSADKTFDEHVAPLLARRCLGCHNSSDLKGDLDLSRAETSLAEEGPIVPGDFEGSLLWQMVDGNQMPPKKPLDPTEKKLLADWIAAGAVWGTSPIDVFAYSSDARAGRDWWSLQPLRAVELPEVGDKDWPLRPIDRFVLARLEAEGLAPSPPADRVTLVRRLAIDLTGLPPTPEEVDAFVNDREPNAYERLVDRLLATPDHGERWARHWLDLARFGESNGFEYDEPRANAWPYRDWVIRALNEDMPYDEFTRRQLAGDVLDPNDPAGIVATGFLAAGAYDTAGQKQQSAAMKAVVRQDELEDIVATVGQTFLGLTVNCARCHDHKFDPIRQEEYYRLTAAFAGVRHGEREVTSRKTRDDYAKRVAEAKMRKLASRLALDAIDGPVRARILAETKRSEDSPPVAPPAPIAEWKFETDLRDAVGQLHGSAKGAASIKKGGLQLDGKNAYVVTAPLSVNLHAKTLEAWVTLATLDQSGGGVMSVQTLDGEVFDAIVFGERERGQWMAGSDHFRRTQSCSGPVEDKADQQTVHVAIVHAEDGVITVYRDGQPYGRSYHGGGPVPFKAGEACVVFGMRHGPPGGNKMLAGAIELARLHDRALSAEEIGASARSVSPSVSDAQIAARLSREEAANRARLIDDIERWDALLAPPPRQHCYCVVSQDPGATRVLVRGDTRSPGAMVSAGGIESVRGVAAEFGLPADAGEGERRKALAHWITSTNNPLFARVIVNRLWHHHFGVGIVDTPNDFGFNGGRPTHPELLDWLALTLLERKWSLKELHREIVLSATYRQSSMARESGGQKDADNRLLWRKSPTRLEAEAVRDGVLFVAGELNRVRGGPSFRDCEEIIRSGSHSYVPADPVGPEFQRRSIYRAWIRGGRSGLLDAFDCPDPSTTTPRRAVTTTPQQALSLQNGSFMLRMADLFAKRVAREVAGEVEDQVVRAYRLAYGRRPSDEELRVAVAVVRENDLSVLTRAIFNSNEFLYVD